MTSPSSPIQTPRRRLFLAAFYGLSLACVGLTSWANAAPVMVEGQPFETQVRVADTPLLLNGTGVRAVAWFKGYAVGLYLRSKTDSADQAEQMSGPKRLQLRMLQDVPAVEFSKAVHKGVQRNTDAATLLRLNDRLAEFEQEIQALKQVRRGDVIDLDLEPGRGMAMRVNGTLRGAVISGDDFFAAVLRSFVGEVPYDKKLKAGLLGRVP